MKVLITAVLAGATALLYPVLVTQPAAATSCVGWPEDVALDAVRGRLPDPFGGAGDRDFTDSYDYAVVGNVRSLNQGTRNAEVVVDVDAAFFLPDAVRRTVTLSMSDLGGMNGYPFEPGRTYFIPVRATADRPGSRPMTNYVFVCDPVKEVRAAETATLVAAAGEAGVAVARPASTSGATSATASGTHSGPWPAIGAWSVIGVAVVAPVSVTARRFRRA